MKHSKAISLATKIILSLVSLVLVSFIVSKSMQTYHMGKDIGNALTEIMYEAYEDIIDQEIKQLDQEELVGSRVVNYIKKYLGEIPSSETSDIYIKVVTDKSDHKYWNGSCVKDITNFSSTKYIKPTAIFKAEVETNNKAVIGVTFMQK